MNHRPRSFILAALLLSLILHVGFAVFIFSYPMTSPRADVVAVEVQFQRVRAEPQKILRSLAPAKSRVLQKADLETKSELPQTNDSDDARSDVGSVNETTTVESSALGIQTLYPRLSRIMGEEGRVLIHYDGKVVTLEHSSGFSRLDQAALDAARDALSKGKFKSFGNVSSISFVFRLSPAAP